MDELATLERQQTIRILDLLFVYKDAETGDSSPSTTRVSSARRNSRPRRSRSSGYEPSGC